jgi:hypothetical protein
MENISIFPFNRGHPERFLYCWILPERLSSCGQNRYQSLKTLKSRLGSPQYSRRESYDSKINRVIKNIIKSAQKRGKFMYIISVS